ncbi:MAG TPA: hypothetical protein VK511_06040 [Gemmatimonadaceae bacterium]|nr:hypothetical protein [Gemmatimonadaceae bacterium]
MNDAPVQVAGGGTLGLVESLEQAASATSKPVPTVRVQTDERMTGTS